MDARKRLMVFARKLLGRKGVFLLRTIVSETSFYLRLVPPANSIGREDGISAMVCTYNESDWVEPSLLSIKDLVDEYVVVDSSTDDTPKKIMDLSKEYGLNIKLYRMPWGDLVAARNKVLKESRYKWILVWDADFIAMDYMPTYVRKLIEELDPRKYYLVYWKLACLDVDLFHQNPHSPIHIEHWLFTYSPALRYEWVGICETLIAPLKYYKPVFVDKILGLHLRTVRNPVRLLYKSLWWRMRREGLERKMSIDEYVRTKIRELYGTNDVREAAEIHRREMLKKMIRYNRELYGDYPSILKKYAREKLGIRL